MNHFRGAPPHPQTQSKTDRGYPRLNNRILLEQYYLPGNPEQKIGNFTPDVIIAIPSRRNVKTRKIAILCQNYSKYDSEYWKGLE